MDKETKFEYIEENDVSESKAEERQNDAFITGLPDWDLEPLFDTVDRSEKN